MHKKKFDEKDFRLARDIAYETRAKAIEAGRIAKFNTTNLKKPRFAKIQSVDGFSEISKTNGESWQRARNNIFLYRGDIVRTYDSANVRIVFEDDSVVRIYPNSYVILSDLYKHPTLKEKRTGLKIGYYKGKAELRADTKSAFRFDMPDLKINAEKNSDIKARIDESGFTGIEVYRGKVKGSTSDKEFELIQREKITIDPERKIFKKGTIPFSPLPILPVSMSLFTFPNQKKSKVELRWSKVDNAVKYRIQIATDFFFSKIIHEKEIKLNTHFMITELSQNNYFWHVNSIDKDGIESEYCNYRIFKIVFGEKNNYVTEDIESPVIDINFINVYGDVVDISGSSEAEATLVVNGKVEKTEPDGTFRITYTHSEVGEHFVIIEAIDSAGNHSKVVKSINIDF